MLKSKKDIAGYSNSTNSEFAEFRLHRGNSVSSLRERRREEISLELDDGSSGSKFLATFLAYCKLPLPLESSFQ